MNRLATPSDLEFCISVDTHISSDLIQKKITNNEIYINELEGKPVGYLRFNYFWDEIPFMNLLWILEEYRTKGIGKILVSYWEQQMKNLGYTQVLTSSMQNETAQHFYRKIGYTDIGSLSLEEQDDELFFHKILY